MEKILTFSKNKRLVIFFIFVVVIVGIVLVSSFIDSFFPSLKGFISLATKAILIILLLLYMKKHNVKTAFHSRKIFYYYAIIYFVISFFSNFRLFNKEIDILLLIVSVFGLITSVILEEIVFRIIPFDLFEKDADNSTFILLVILFTLSHLGNYFFNDAFATTIQIIVAFCFGLFCIAIYFNTENSIVPSLCHLCMNIPTLVFATCSSSVEPYFGNTVHWILYILIMVISVILGIYYIHKFNRFGKEHYERKI